MKKNGVLRFGLLIAGFIFFANPNISVFDVLPDCIGCLLVIAAIFRIGDVSMEMGEARQAFHVLFWIELSKLPALILVMWITGTSVGEDVMWLLIAFCYAVAEVIFGIRAFSRLFEGFAYFGARREGGDFVFRRLVRPEKQIKNKNGEITVRPARYVRLERIAGITSAFILVRAIACTFPDFWLLESGDSLGYVSVGFSSDRVRSVLMVLGFVFALAVGIIWLVRIIGYTGHLARRKDFWSGIFEDYENTVKTKKGIFAMRRTHIFAVLTSVASLFSVDFYFDEINYIPDFISAILLFAAACVIANQIGGAKWLKLASVLYFATSAVTFVTMIRFTSDYAYSAVHKIERARELYIPYAVSNAVSQVAFILAFSAVASVVMKIVRAHTGINTITGVSNSSKPLERVYAGRAVRLRIFTALAGIMSSLYFYFVVDVKSVALRNDGYGTGGYLYFPKFEIVWMVDFLFAMIFAVFTCNLLYDLLSEVRYKYKYE